MFRGKWRGGSGGGGGSGTVTSVGTAADGSSGGAITGSGVITIDGGFGIDTAVSTSPATDFTVSATLTGATATSASAYSVPATVDVVLVDASTGAVTVNLPSAATNAGRVINVKDDGSASLTNDITIYSAGGAIDNGTSFVMNAPLQSVSVWSHNSNWWIL